MAFTFKDFNTQQKALRFALKAAEFDAAIELVLSQHGWTHQSRPLPISSGRGWTWKLSAPSRQRGEHSIAWCLWHLARIEETALSVGLAGVPMLLDEEDWAQRLNVPYRDTGNEMPPDDVAILSQQIDMDALKAYRAAVGVRSRGFIHVLTKDQLKVNVTPEQIQQIVDLGAVRPEAESLLEFWRRRTMEGLLLMPASRHNMVHINEALRLKEKMIRRKK